MNKNGLLLMIKALLVVQSFIISFLYFSPASATPQHAHYWVVDFQSQNSGYKIVRLRPSLFRIVFHFFLSSNDVSGLPLLPYEIHLGSFPSKAIFPRILSLSSYCLLSVHLSFSFPSTSSSAGFHLSSAHLKYTAFRLTAGR